MRCRIPARGLRVALVTLALAGCAGGAGPSPASQPEPASSTGQIEDVIRAKAPGVTVLRRGQSLSIAIPGAGVDGRGDGAPMIILDGVQLASASDLLHLNPRDVVTVKVVKGAATSMYGVRAQNGVLEITTRRSK